MAHLQGRMGREKELDCDLKVRVRVPTLARQTHRQPHRLDGGVPLVAGKKYQIAFHVYSFFSSTAGLVRAALRVCQSTVPKAMASEMMTATTNTQP